MTICEEELNVLSTARKEMFKACDRDEINMIYKQARIWVRIHWRYGNACSKEKSWYLNNKLKQYRIDALKTIG